MTVHDLRKNGYKVRVLHFRKWDDRVLAELYPKGGSTVVQITTPEGENFQATALCSNEDRYNKKIGVKIALGRIKNKLNIAV
jgi:hypothetical protein